MAHCPTCTCTSKALDPDRPWHEHDLIDIRRYGGALICPAEYNTNDDEGLSCLIAGHHDGRPHESWIGPWCSACGREDMHTEDCPDHDAPNFGRCVKVLFTGDRPSDIPTYWCADG
jgi:hypothetical protein